MRLTAATGESRLHEPGMDWESSLARLSIGHCQPTPSLDIPWIRNPLRLRRWQPRRCDYSRRTVPAPRSNWGVIYGVGLQSFPSATPYSTLRTLLWDAPRSAV